MTNFNIKCVMEVAGKRCLKELEGILFLLQHKIASIGSPILSGALFLNIVILEVKRTDLVFRIKVHHIQH
jgi:hypothetical protein